MRPRDEDQPDRTRNGQEGDRRTQPDDPLAVPGDDMFAGRLRGCLRDDHARASRRKPRSRAHRSRSGDAATPA